ncbi:MULTISPECIES: DUF6458 family protein [Nocardioides]|uniref:DUF6458 family protein n=1 Tax=Nocardioides TaxID=1839 RepID=UPI00106F8DD8|nr:MULTISPECIES: DUF6458 family protein [Nocardioides]QCW51970.1 hypothetical protein FE634_19005 [Nocardioides sp. S-1144]
MGYGFGAFLLVVGLVLALAVKDSVDAVDLVTVGWIMAAVGVAVIALTAITFSSSRRRKSVVATTHPDGSQTVQERRDTQM